MIAAITTESWVVIASTIAALGSMVAAIAAVAYVVLTARLVKATKPRPNIVITNCHAFAQDNGEIRAFYKNIGQRPAHWVSFRVRDKATKKELPTQEGTKIASVPPQTEDDSPARYYIILKDPSFRGTLTVEAVYQNQDGEEFVEHYHIADYPHEKPRIAVHHED